MKKVNKHLKIVNKQKNKYNISDEDIIAELELGDEERLLPTDLLNDDDEDFESSSNSNSNSNSKIPLRKTWSWTPEQLPFDHQHQDQNQQEKQKSENNNNCENENSVKSTNKKPELRQLEKAIKSLSIDPNMSISRKF